MENIYILSTNKRSLRNIYKVGRHTGEKIRLINRYKTPLINPIVYLFQRVTTSKTAEKEIKEELNHFRIKNKNGRKTEWIIMEFSLLKQRITPILDKYEEPVESSDENYDDFVEYNDEEFNNYYESSQMQNFDNSTDFSDDDLSDLSDSDYSDDLSYNQCSHIKNETHQKLKKYLLNPIEFIDIFNSVFNKKNKMFGINDNEIGIKYLIQRICETLNVETCEVDKHTEKIEDSVKLIFTRPNVKRKISILNYTVILLKENDTSLRSAISVNPDKMSKYIDSIDFFDKKYETILNLVITSIITKV